MNSKLLLYYSKLLSSYSPVILMNIVLYPNYL